MILNNVKTLPKGMVEISIEVPVEDMKRDLEEAAEHLSKDRPIPGYRPGKAPYDVVKAKFGEMAIYEHALGDVVRKGYVKSVKERGLRTYGEPTVNITKLAPGNALGFTATVALVPKVLSLPDYREMTVESKEPVIEDAAVDQAVKELQRMQTKEVRADREARDKDKVVVDMDLTVDKVAIEGGQARSHGIYLDEEYYVPGFKEKVLGMKEGESKSFSLKFPDTHYQKHIAGRDVDFAVTVKEVYELIHPALDAEFAKSLGQKSMDDLRGVIKKNMAEEAEEKERQRAEIEALDAIVAKAKFEDIPDTIVTMEVERMIAELKDGISSRGMQFDQYLNNIKKTEDDLRLEFSAQAVKRVKSALVIREIGEQSHIEVSDEELLAEVQRQLNAYSQNTEAQERLRSDDYQDYLRTTMRNRKVIDMIRKAVVRPKS